LDAIVRKIDALSAPLFVSWQVTRDCNLACLHCCTDSAPGKRLDGELSREEALRLARQIVSAEVPYAMLAGGEPLLVDWFWEVAGILGRGGVQLKIESNGHLLTREAAEKLKPLPIRSVQISLDGATEETYAKQRVHGSLAKAVAGCREVVRAGLPLEVTFAPTSLNIGEVEAVARLASELGAFRFNTGMLMRIGTAAKLWDKLQPAPGQYSNFKQTVERLDKEYRGEMELCYLPWSVEQGLRDGLSEPPATLQILPDGRVKVAAPLPFICADLKELSLEEAWSDYRAAWDAPEVQAAAARVLEDPARLAKSNDWTNLAGRDLLAAGKVVT
jgi:MoaA/NifB/PqqE/SkfB family radical SAM enzyme